MQRVGFLGGRNVKTPYTCESIVRRRLSPDFGDCLQLYTYLGSIDDNDVAVAMVPGYHDCTGGREQPTVAVEGEVEPDVVLELEDGLSNRPRLRLRHGSLPLVGELKKYNYEF